MSRICVVLLLLGIVAGAQAPEEAQKQVLEYRLEPGARTLGLNRVTYTVTMSERMGLETVTRTESVQRTERFLDQVMRAGVGGIVEIKRTYNMAQVKIKNDETKRKVLEWSPMNGRTVRILERARKREVKLEGRGVVDAFTRKTIGMELDWRDLFQDYPVGPGDAWDAETFALGRRMAAYLSCGDKSRMRVRYEENVVRDGRKQAKLYVDWTLEGMRDRHLFAKAQLAGDLYFDFEDQRIVEVDLGGSIRVNGTIMVNGTPKIIKGEGPLSLESTVKPAPIEAAAPGSDGEDEKR
jgi:hypothetical protein